MMTMRRRCARIGIRAAMASALLVTAVASAAAQNEGNTIRFKGGIGVIPVSNGVQDNGTATTAAVAPSVTRNIVRGVQPPGQIWVIDDLDAKVRADGRITVDGKGLVLGGGNNAGRSPPPPGTLSVFATLICEAAAPFTELSTNLA